MTKAFDELKEHVAPHKSDSRDLRTFIINGLAHGNFDSVVMLAKKVNAVRALGIYEEINSQAFQLATEGLKSAYGRIRPGFEELQRAANVSSMVEKKLRVGA